MIQSIKEPQTVQGILTELEGCPDEQAKMVIKEAIRVLKERNIIQDITKVTISLFGDIVALIKSEIYQNESFKLSCAEIPLKGIKYEKESFIQRAIDYLNKKNDGGLLK